MKRLLDPIDVRRLAAEIEVDWRSVAKQLRGEHVRGLAGDRIRRTLRERGLLTEEKEATK